MGKGMASKRFQLERRLYAGTLRDCVILSAAVLQAERRISFKLALCSSVTDVYGPTAIKRTMRSAKQFFVYIVTGGPKSAVRYTGVTGNLVRRVGNTRTNSLPDSPVVTT